MLLLCHCTGRICLLVHQPINIYRLRLQSEQSLASSAQESIKPHIQFPMVPSKEAHQEGLKADHFPSMLSCNGSFTGRLLQCGASMTTPQQKPGLRPHPWGPTALTPSVVIYFILVYSCQPGLVVSQHNLTCPELCKADAPPLLMLLCSPILSQRLQNSGS